MVGAALTYIIVNILIVTFVISEFTSTSWRARLATVGISGFNSSMGTSFMGLLFTLFVLSYRFWGLLAFGALLVHFAELLKATAVVSGEREKRRELEEELVIDEMTQAYNFRYLSNWLNDSDDAQVGVLFVDIDDFKVFNDLYGHAEGDVVLKTMTETIKKSVRADDQIIRYGGDEFVVLLPGMDSEGAKRVARRIQSNLSKLPYATWKKPITVSIGIASTPEDTTDRRELLLLADQAMYEAKSSGKNTLCVNYLQKGPA
jgi:diguanylate cyclase (GGDEF)-like protein